MVKRKKVNRYSRIVEKIFLDRFRRNDREIAFVRADIENVAKKLRIKLPKNQGDIIYSFRYRSSLPASIAKNAPAGLEWIIRPAGRGRYKFVLVKEANIIPNEMAVKTKIPDATPGIVARYSFDDEQALLAKIRYNRLIDIFTGVTCYSLQNHLRTTVADLGQVETDEVYIGIDAHGVHYVFPIQAKGGSDKIGVVQIEQDFLVCAEKYPDAIGRPIAAQFLEDGAIVLFEFTQTEEGVRVVSERHYSLVDPDDLSADELRSYRSHSTDYNSR